MGVIPKVATPAPVFIHVDIDDLWSLGECYGYTIDAEQAHHVSTDALPRFARLFDEFQIKATFFIVGKDLDNPAYVQLLRDLVAAGHCVANHSYSHNLSFRSLSPEEMHQEIDSCHSLITQQLRTDSVGFRAPGYAGSAQLTKLLEERGYRYDGSLMPSPYGPIFRWMDRRLQNPFNLSGPKTQFPLLSDTWHSLYPQPIPGGRLVQLPTAASPLLRLPLQAGVCMRLGYPYFRTLFQPCLWNRALPLVFLFHAADLTDFSTVTGELFRRSSFFNSPLDHRLSVARRILSTITRHRPVITTEQWLT